MIKPTFPTGYQLALPRENGTVLEYPVTPGRDAEVERAIQLDALFAQITDDEAWQLLHGLRHHMARPSAALPVHPRARNDFAALRAGFDWVVGFVVRVLGLRDESECCGAGTKGGKA